LEKRKLCEGYTRIFGAISTNWERLNLVGIIYRIVNLVNGKSYIGQTIYWFDHRYRSGRWWIRTDNILLERAAIKYGVENFAVKILAYNIPSIKELNELEVEYIAKYKTFVNDGNGYNLDRGGNNKSSLGRPHSQETKDKISNSQRGNKNHMFGKIVSIESRIKMSRAGKGRKQLPEHINKRTSKRKNR